MNGQFEIDNTAYPVGYLKSQGDHRVFDMRSLRPYHDEAITKEEAIRVSSAVNAKLRNGDIKDINADSEDIRATVQEALGQ